MAAGLRAFALVLVGVFIGFALASIRPVPEPTEAPVAECPPEAIESEEGLLSDETRGLFPPREIGPVLDPEKRPASAGAEVIEIGEPRDPDREPQFIADPDAVIVELGEPRDPDA